MDDIFITSIQTSGLRNVNDTLINLSDNERKHLIVTGKNGSGKTTFLEELYKFARQHLLKIDIFERTISEFEKIQNRFLELQKRDVSPETTEYKSVYRQILNYTEWSKGLPSVRFQISPSSTVFAATNLDDYQLYFFRAKRASEINIPNGVQKTSIESLIKNSNNDVNKQFLQYLVNLKAEKSFARDDGDNNVVKHIDDWFDKLTNMLRNIFDNPTLKLEFDRRNYTFNIIEDGKEPYTFNQLSDGFSAIIDIVSELILRMDAKGGDSYDRQGIVLIDEVETHLHVDLQKKIMPFLTAFFPKIQFIVSTHSPFVLTSIPNAVIWDMHSGKILNEDLTALSSSALTESYFDVDEYSNLLKGKVTRFETLSKKSPDLDTAEQEELQSLADYFAEHAQGLGDELQVKLHQIKRQKVKTIKSV